MCGALSSMRCDRRTNVDQLSHGDVHAKAIIFKRKFRWLNLTMKMLISMTCEGFLSFIHNSGEIVIEIRTVLWTITFDCPFIVVSDDKIFSLLFDRPQSKIIWTNWTIYSISGERNISELLLNQINKFLVTNRVLIESCRWYIRIY